MRSTFNVGRYNSTRVQYMIDGCMHYICSTRPMHPCSYVLLHHYATRLLLLCMFIDTALSVLLLWTLSHLPPSQVDHPRTLVWLHHSSYIQLFSWGSLSLSLSLSLSTTSSNPPTPTAHTSNLLLLLPEFPKTSSSLACLLQVHQHQLGQITRTRTRRQRMYGICQ